MKGTSTPAAVELEYLKFGEFIVLPINSIYASMNKNRNNAIWNYEMYLRIRYKIPGFSRYSDDFVSLGGF